MRSAKVLLLSVFLSCLLHSVIASERSEVESRGKKKKIALFVYFADIILKKIFILKLIYAFVFWIVIHKAGYFLSWFVTYLKEKKHEHHHYVPHHHYDHGPLSYDTPSYGAPSYGPPSYGPYKRKSHGI